MNNDSGARLFGFHIRCFDNVVGGQESGCVSKAFLESRNVGRAVSDSNWPEFCGICGGEVDYDNSIYLGFYVRDGGGDL